MALTGLIFLAGYVSGLGLALFRHPLFGLYTYVAVFYLHPPSRWWGEFLPDLRWSLIAAAVTLISMWRLKPAPNAVSWIRTTPGVILLAFTAWLWLQNFWALDSFEHLEASILFTKYVVLYFLMFRLLDTAEKTTWFLLVHIAGCFYLGWLGFSSDVSGRLEGVGGPGIDEANALSMHLATAVVAGAMIILTVRGWRQIACILAMPFVLNAMVLSGSRGSFVAVVVGGLALVLLKPRAHRKLFYSFAALGVVLFLMLSPDTFWERVRTITAPVEKTAEVDNSTESRIELFKAQLKMAARYPHGTGHRGTAVLSSQYLDTRYLTTESGPVEIYGARSSHNTFMSVWVEQGIPGVILVLALGAWILRSIGKLRRHNADASNTATAMQGAAAVAGLAVVIIAGLFTDYLKAEVQVWLLAVLATIIYIRMPQEAAAATPVATASRLRGWAAEFAARRAPGNNANASID
jgi:O-antigen ligase